MSLIIKEGNYTQMGVMQVKDQAVYTFEGEKEDSCSIFLENKNTGVKTEIKVPNEYCLGSLRSVAVCDIKAEDYLYYYEINGVKKIDPYASAISGREVWNDQTRADNNYDIKCAYRFDDYNWKNDKAPEISKDKLLIYKLHVRGFSKKTGGKKTAGTFVGVKNKLNHIKDLGFTAIELMPVYEFEEIDIPPVVELPNYVKWDKSKTDIIEPIEPEKIIPKVNYWGYEVGNYFAVKSSYGTQPNKAGVEFKELVDKMHELGIECIMEIFFSNNANHHLVLDALRFWVREYHVDGFHLLGENLPITAIVQDVMLSRTKIFYHEFDNSIVPENKKYKTLFVYKEEYLYPARKILNHMNGEMREFLNQQKKQGSELGFVNYVASNNGFSLADLFMYNDRHNEANGENNTDGNPWNFSNNYGIEGPTRKKYIKNIRDLKWRNAIMMLFLAQGVPMIWAGDEMGNTQMGNNNAYCQDNEIGWTDWKSDKTRKAQLEFIKNIIRFRQENPIISKENPFAFSDYRSYGFPDLSYHGENAWISEYELDRMSVGLLYCGDYAENENDNHIYVGYNFYSARGTLALPNIGKKKKWYIVADSTDSKEPFKAEPVLCKNQQYVEMNPQEICILVGK